MQHNPKTFFRNTYCEFTAVEFDFSTLKTYTSKSGSVYHYTEKGVYRCSNHWGRVANCRWKLLGVKNYKNQQSYVGYANWSDFYDLKATDKVCSLQVDMQLQEVLLKVNFSEEGFKFSIQNALQRKKEIESVFKNDKWLKYIDGDSQEIKRSIVNQLLNSNLSLQEVKLNIKSSF